MRIGVLCLQGDFREHVSMLRRLGVEAIDVRLPSDLEHTRGLILPGGESTALRRLLSFSGLDHAIAQHAARAEYGLYGTCAGMILMAKSLRQGQGVEPLGLMDITVARNAYGRQLDSFEADVAITEVGTFHAVFIRAPQLIACEVGVEVLGRHEGVPVIARQGNLLVSSFHPELSNDARIHEYFVSEVCAPQRTRSRA